MTPPKIPHFRHFLLVDLLLLVDISNFTRDNFSFYLKETLGKVQLYLKMSRKSILMILVVTLGWVSTEEVFDDMKKGFFACDQIKNVTVLPWISYQYLTQQLYYSTKTTQPFIPTYINSMQQISYLVKTLLDTPCVMVWIYSPLQARLIRQQREQKQNYNHFIATEIQGMNEPDKNKILELLLDFKNLNYKNKQTLFIITDDYDGVFMTHPPDNNGVFTIDPELSLMIKEIDSLPNKNVVVWCTWGSRICHQGNTFIYRIPRERFISHGQEPFNPHIHKTFVDLMISDHDRFKEYSSLECRNKTRELTLRFWTKEPFNSFMGLGYLIDSLVNTIQFNVDVDGIKTPPSVPQLRSVGLKCEFWHGKYIDSHWDIQRLAYSFSKTDGDVINIVVQRDQIIPEELKYLGEWMYIVFDDSITDSPRFEPNGATFVIWETDLASPVFLRMLIDKFQDILC